MHLKIISKLFLLRREYLSSAVNGLTKCPQTLHISQKHFFNTNILHKDQ